ncbi:MAG: rhodanese-like domain-containing protein [Sulfurimonadaceae bacterium]|nr:rhodanese-like domain-containing protein [Sulfurimonadaceae bacterium]
MFSNSVKVLSASELAERSNDDYSLNNYGVVSAEKAATWITDWKHNKPAGVSGKLFVMQVGNVYGETHNFIKHNGVDTFTFDRTDGCSSTGDFRNDGVSNVPKPVFSGQQMDDAFKAYNIDPKHDMFLIVLAEGSGSYYAGAVRMWYTLTYWGIPQKNIAVLNGQASHVLNPEINTNLQALGINSKDDVFTANPSVPTMDGTHTIAEIKRDGTILQATMGDMMELVASGAENATIIDARSEAEYFGTKKAKTEFKVCGADGASQCYTAFDGHIKGAQNIYYTDVVNTDDATSDINGDGVVNGKDASYSFKDIYDIESTFAGAGYTEGDTAYIYCRTGTKASLLTFTSAAILGYPTRMYDGSWIQWGKMADGIDTHGNQLLPVDSPWRTDTADYSDSIVYNMDSDKVSPHAEGSLHLDNSGTNDIINADKAYKLLK